MKRLALILAGVAIDATAVEPPRHDTDRALCAAVLILEAGGEVDSTGHSRAAMSAVWEVVWQRAENRKLSPVGVVTQRKQFSCLNNITPGRAITTAQKHPFWRHAWGITAAPPLTRYTKGADHYHANTIRPPYWADPAKKTVTIGKHTFYKLKP
jgi:spore germination cell wall hydrolase CwlJ-like protein